MTPPRGRQALLMLAALASIGGLAIPAELRAPEPRRREPDPPPPPPPPEPMTEEQARAALERHRAWCAEQDAAAERRRAEEEHIARGRHIESYLGLRKHDPPLTEEEIAEALRTGKSPLPAPPPTREQARRVTALEPADVQEGAADPARTTFDVGGAS